MTKTPKRILLVDNDKDVLASVSYSLKVEGYRVLTAESVEVAHKLLDYEIFHLAIIDIRLEDEKYKKDTSGFKIARGLPAYIPCVIYTAYEDKDNIREALSKIGAKEIVDKTAPDASAKLIDIVNSLFGSSVKVNFDLKIEETLNLDGLAAQIDISQPDKSWQPSADDIRQVFQALFHEAMRLYIVPLLSPALAPTFTQSGSVLLQAQPQFKNGLGVPVVVKLSAREEIAQEANNYRIIKPFLGGQRLAVLDGEQGVAYSRQIGGLVYSLIGAADWEAIHVFDEVFLHQNTETVISLLEQFFRQTFGALFADAQRDTLNLTAIYTQSLHLTAEKLRAALAEFHPEALSDMGIRFKGLKGIFKNPIMWGLREGKFRNFEVFSRKCLCHGDLHGRNILVDNDGHFWLVDFARVAESHALRDFIGLESYIKFNLLPTIDLETVLPFEQALLTPANFRDALVDVPFDSDRLDHTYQVILALRRIASDLMDLEGDMREYYKALLFYTLNILCMPYIGIEKKEHALLSAALICQRLENWSE